MNIRLTLLAGAATVGMCLASLSLAVAPASAANSTDIVPSALTVANGQAFSVSFPGYTGALAGNEAICWYVDGEKDWTYGWDGGETPSTVSVSAGTLDEGLNLNKSGIDKVLTFAWMDLGINGVGTGDCPTYLDELYVGYTNGPITLNAFEMSSWTVTPAIQGPVTQTIYVGQANNTPATVVESYAGLAIENQTTGALWSDPLTPNYCDESFDSDVPAVDLPTGLSINTTPAPPGVIPALFVQGTPAAGSEGTYHMCLMLEADRAVYTFFDLTIAAAPAALPETGTDEKLVAGLTSSAVILVLAGLALMVSRVVRRSATSRTSI